MVSIRTHSIQDILKNINRSIGFYDIFALFVLLVIFSLLCLFIFRHKDESVPVVYISNETSDSEEEPASHIFASVSGKTFTYAWCSGASRIKEKNKIFFKNEAEALKSGRVLSKLCQ